MAKSRPPAAMLAIKVDGPSLEIVGGLATVFTAAHSLALDMHMVQVALKERESRPEVLPPKLDAGAMALWSGVVIVYGRCFQSGWRKHVSDLVPVPESLRARHEYLLDVRHTHVAHVGREDTQDIARVILRLKDPKSGSTGVRDVVVLGAMAANIDDEVPESLRLAAYFEREFRAMARDVGAAIVALANERSESELYVKSRVGSGKLRMDQGVRRSREPTSSEVTTPLDPRFYEIIRAVVKIKDELDAS